MIQGQSNYECVNAFLRAHPISTAGALNTHTITVENKEDGDVYTKATVPFWWMNKAVVQGVLTLALEASKHGAKVYLRKDAIELQFIHSACDPQEGSW